MELINSGVGLFSVRYKLRSMQDNFVWGLIGIYGPKEESLGADLRDEQITFMSLRDISWRLGGDFNVARFPKERSSLGRSTSTMNEFSDFIESSNLINALLESTRLTWLSHEEAPILSRT